MGVTGWAWVVVLAMAVWAAYLYFAWGGAEALPMQWTLSGKPTWYAARGAALAFFPVLGVFVVTMLSFARRGVPLGASVVGVALLLLAIQAVWVFFARRYV